MSNLLTVMLRWLGCTLLRNEWHALRQRIQETHSVLVLNPNLCAPLIAQQLLISGEDHRFLRHPGFDLIAIGRAIWRRFRCRKIEGASTIEQQLVRVLTQRFERTLNRKLREILLSSLVASEFKKEILPAIYLHVGYYGWNLHSFDSARRKLKDLDGLSLLSAAQLVARLKYPEPRYQSLNRKIQIESRVQHLLHLHTLHLRDGTYGHNTTATVPTRLGFGVPNG